MWELPGLLRAPSFRAGHVLKYMKERGFQGGSKNEKGKALFNKVKNLFSPYENKLGA